MIAASEPQEFVPFGRQQIKKHPGSVILSGNPQHLPYDSLLAQRISEVILDDGDENEWWSMRLNDGVEEELYVSGPTAIVSRGTVGRSVAFGRLNKASSRQLQACFTMESPIRQALWANFVQIKETNFVPLPSLCIVDSTKNLRVFTDIDDYLVPLQFKVSGVWPTRFGLLLERVAHRHLEETESGSNLTTLFSLLHPLDEIAPLLTIKPGGLLTYMNDPCLKVMFTSETPSLCLIYNMRTGEHSIWKLRQTLPAECQWMCGNESGLSLHNSCQTIFSGANLSSGSVSQFSLRAPHINRSSPLLGRPSDGSQVGRNSHYTLPRVASPLTRQDSSSCSSMEARLDLSLAPKVETEPKPIVPELCLEYLWTDSTSFRKDCGDRLETGAKKCFLTQDMLDQEYLAYLTDTTLVLVRLGLTNTEESFVGTVTRLPAIDAVSIQRSKMVCLLDPSSGCVMLYTGATPIGKLHLAGVSAELASSSYLSCMSVVPRVNSPFSKCTSLLSSTKLGEGLFDESAHLLSPVLSDIGHSPGRDHIRALRDPLGSKFTLEFSSGTMFRFTMPEFSSSPLVSHCLEVVKVTLPRDLALTTLVKWFSIRNAPGTQDFSPKHEWHLFMSALLGLLGYQLEGIPLMSDCFSSSCETPGKNTKKMKASDLGSNEDWSYLLGSSYQTALGPQLSHILHLSPPTDTDISEPSPTGYPPISTQEAVFNTQAPLFNSIHLILFSFHLLYEELKLAPALSDSLGMLVRLLHQLAKDLGLTHYCHYYWRDFPTDCPIHTQQVSLIPKESLEKMGQPSFLTPVPPSLFEEVHSLVTGDLVLPYPYIPGVNTKSKDLLEICSMMSGVPMVPLRSVVPPGSRCHTPQPILLNELPQNLSHQHKAVLLMVKLGMSRDELFSMPGGLGLLLASTIQKVSEDPPAGWPSQVYHFIGRLDLVNPPPEPQPHLAKEPPSHKKLSKQVLKLRFNKDERMLEVKRLLDSSEPVSIAITQKPEVSDHEFIEEQERHLYAICTRTMALPVGRGMLKLHTCTPLTSEPLEIPKLCLTGRAPPRGTTVELSHIEVVPNMNMWPLFHNGVAAGLKISPNTTDINASWIIYNKPKGESDSMPEHAGFLMALGLSGHINVLKELNLFSYLNKCHEMTSVGLLLGLAAAKRGTMDFRLTRSFSVHIESLLPPTAIEIALVQNIQVAALLGIGLIYQGTAHRHMIEVLLAEIGRPPGPEMENSSDRECYSLAAGLGLGLVVLGKGAGPTGLSDPPIADTLQYYMSGGTKRPLTGSQKDKYKSPSYQIREGDTVNNHVTGPGATLALGMMYFNTGNLSIAKWLEPPDSEYTLDFVCPDMLLLRTLAHGLVLWSDVRPTRDWVRHHVPSRILPYCMVKPREGMDNIDLETMNQAYCNIIAGACMAVGLRFAGSANNEAYETLMHYCKYFVNVSTKSLAELPGKSTIETCICVTLLSLAMVMVGSGDLNVLRLCRHLGGRIGPTPAVTYGSHLAVHMSLGLLFLGGGLYTLSTSPEAVAAMLCAFFPRFPTHSNDNRYHLQAFRHLYVLAVERRLLLPRDIQTGQLCYAHLTIAYLDTPYYKDQTAKLFAPCLLPELSLLKEVKIDDERYWPIVFRRDKNWADLERVLKCDIGCCIKQRAGCLPYSEDKHGFRTLLAQTLSTAEATSWAIPTESILSFTSHPTITNFVRCFLECPSSGYGSPSSSVKEESLVQWLSAASYHLTVSDRLPLLHYWITILAEMLQLDSFPSPIMSWQLKLALLEISQDRTLGMSVAHFISALLDKWAQAEGRLIGDYVRLRPVEGSPEELTALASYLTLTGIPLQSVLAESYPKGGPSSLLDLIRALSGLRLSSAVLKKLWHFYQYQEDN